MVMSSPLGTPLHIFRDRIVETQFSFLGQQHDHGGDHRLGIGGDPEMRIGARWGRAAELRRAVAEYEIALRRAQENHGARQQEFLAQRFDDALKRGRFDRLETCCGRCRPAYRASHWLSMSKVAEYAGHWGVTGESHGIARTFCSKI
jgi:hypothetical protein